jgi:choline dehydrogenase
MTFDYIIVGAGSAGCVLADRLTEGGRHKVLVLEAGGSDHRFWVQVPLGYGRTFYDPAVNWGYHAEPDPGLAGKSDYWPRGKVLGGSSSINAMVYIRGNSGDYDDWAAAGNPGWGWTDVLPLFRGLEHNEEGASDFRGVNGKLNIADVSEFIHPLARIYLKAAREAGLTLNSDLNGPEQDGAGLYQITARNGRRMSAARAFLRPAMRRNTLRVEMDAQVTRLLFEGKRVTGVEYRQGGKLKTAKTGGEVILAGGAVNSPQLLQLSGIGPAARLQALGVPVLLDQPNVGQHLTDHLGLNYTFKSRIPTLNSSLRPWWGKLWAGMQYVFARSGPLSLSMNQAGGFFRTRPDLARPNMQLYVQAISTLTAKTGTRPLLDPDPFDAFNLGLSSCRPTSRGSITIKSADPFAAPAIVPNAFSTSADVEEMLAAVKFLRKLAATPSLSAIIEAELAPGPDCRSDDELIADFRQRSGTVYHPAGTCRMGPHAAGAVVDPRLRVHGIGGLRVIDASIMPNIVAGNTNAAALMIGAKGATLVLEDARVA